MKDLVRVAIGFLATLAALVLGLLISSAKETFDARIEEVQRAATKTILLDQELRRLLRRLGPAGATARPSRALFLALEMDQPFGGS